jgi:molybdenum cofactor synthesis domain-containing protein
MQSLEEVRAYVSEHLVSLDPKEVLLDEANGLITTEAIYAKEPIPSFVNSSLDGFALRAHECAAALTNLEVVETILAGTLPSKELAPGECARIMTGAPMPDGADSVSPVEATAPTPNDPNRVVIKEAVTLGQGVRTIGSDVSVGDLLFREGTVLSPGALGVLAAQGYRHVKVKGPVRVGVLSTGDELIDVTTPLRPGTIRDANRHTLLALCREQGFIGVDLGIVGDNETDIRAVFVDASTRCDVVVSSGGVSMGEVDFVKKVLAEECEEMRWFQIAIRPAKPFAFGLLKEKIPFFGLAGNPVSAMVAFELIVRGAIRQMLGHSNTHRAPITARAGAPFDNSGVNRTTYFRARYVEGASALEVVPQSAQESHQLTAMAGAQLLGIVEPGRLIAPGDPIEILAIDESALAYALSMQKAAS